VSSRSRSGLCDELPGRGNLLLACFMDAIYLDNNATTPVLPEVWEAMRPFCGEVFGNPASAHRFGRRARLALEDAREKVASLLEAHADEVLFTSGATESNNLALFGLAGETPGHILASPVEHPCVIEPLNELTRRGSTVERLPVDREGVVPVETVADHLRADTTLVAVMLANHETGAIQPVAELATQTQNRVPGILFHCDAAQAVGRVPVRFHSLGVTSLSLSAHKFHGPKGVGALLLRRGSRLKPVLFGGHQQQGRRPGTEPVALAVGLAIALERAVEEMAVRQEHIRRLRERFLAVVQEKASPVVLNGPGTGGVPHTINLSFPVVQAEALLMNLDLAGVACSTGSACSSGSLLPSPVLQAMGVPDEVLRSAMRFSLSHLLSVEEVEEAAQRIGEAVGRLRRLAAEGGFVSSAR
jgi:cysteine desulfurase